MKIMSGETYYLKQNFVLAENKHGAVVLIAGSPLKLKDRRSTAQGLRFAFYTQNPHIIVYVSEQELDSMVADFITQSEAEYALEVKQKEETKKNAKKA